MNTKDSFVQFLVEAQALKFGNFVTKSGRRTPYFINMGEFRSGSQIASLSKFYAEAFMEHFKDKASNLFGPAYKGIPLCTAVSLELFNRFGKNLTFTYNRKEAKDHGEGGNLVGDLYGNPTDIVIIEDVITAGTSVNETIATLSKYSNAKIVGLLVSVDRKEKLDGKKSALQTVQDEYGIESHAIIDIEDIISFLQNEDNRKAIGATEETLENIRAYRREWGV